VIRINLLGVERQVSRKRTGLNMPASIAQAAPILGGVMVLGALAGVGWWYWSLGQTAAQLDAQLGAKRQEAARLTKVTAELKQFEARRDQLQNRVGLIEKLRVGQSVPVQLLDHVSRSLPDMLWLTDLEQEAGAITIQGRSSTLIGLSDFVGNLASNAVLEKPIEIVKSEVTAAADGGARTSSPPAELIQFTVRARLAGTSAGADAADKTKR
jgi:type IV pilus assembly protein PilN